MAYITATIRSESLSMQTTVRIIMPQSNIKNRKILYLLHGLSDDSSMWTRRTRIEDYAEKHNYTVIMPEVQRSFYMDMKYGGQYFTYVSDELPKLCEKFFGIKHDRSKTFVAGLSMGGYGAMKCGLSKPEFYNACASFSGAVDAVKIFNDNELTLERAAIYGENATTVKDSDNLFKLAVKVNELNKNEKPRIFVCCGTDDFLIEHNRKFNNVMESLDFDYRYIEWEGAHTWDFWDKSVQYAMDFFDNKK